MRSRETSTKFVTMTIDHGSVSILPTNLRSFPLASRPATLDDDNAPEPAELLSSACRERGKSLILVTHDREILRPIDGIFARQGGSLTTIESVLAF